MGADTPSTTAERDIAVIWSAVLGVPDIQREQDFFASGGDSLLATKVILAVRRALDVRVTVQTLVESPVLKDFARQVDLLRVTT